MSRGRWYASHARLRCPRGQAVLSSWCLGKGAQASAGTRAGLSGAQSGNAYLNWAVSKAAGLCRRAPPVAQPSLTRLEQKHGPGTAFPVRAQTVARAVYDLLTRQGACETHTFLPGSWRRAGAPGAALDDERMRLHPALCHRCRPAALHAAARCGRYPGARCLAGPPRALLAVPAAMGAHGGRVLPLCRAWHALDHATRGAFAVRRTGRGQREVSRAPRVHRALSARGVSAASEPQAVFGAATVGHQQTAMQTEHGATGRLRWSYPTAEKNGKSRSQAQGIP